MRISHVENRIEQQISLSALIFQAIESFNKIPTNDITSRLIKARVTALNENWEKFSIFHEAIIVAVRQLSTEDKELIRDHTYFEDDFYARTYKRYLDSLDKMNAYLDSELILPRTSSTQSFFQPVSNQLAVSHHTRLPRIDLPKFSGNASEWMSFKDLFSSIIIGNASLSPVEKLQYLKASLTGTAAHLLKNTALTADNFQKAWTDLISFYENKQLLVNSAIQSLLSLKKITKESSSELERLYTNIMQIYRALETLQRPVEHWDDFLVFLTVQRLDAESVKVWEQHLGSTKEPPTWRHLSKHFLSACPQYTLQTTPQRYSLIIKHGLCYNCLGKHRVSKCPSTRRCLKCGKKHHTTIHRRIPSKTESQTEHPPAKSSTETSVKTTPSQVLHAAVHSSLASMCILLATAQMFIANENGRIMKIKALIDQGSEINIISEKLSKLSNFLALSQIIKDGLIKGPPKTPIAQLTSFGWILSGPASSESTHRTIRSYHISMDSRLYDLLHRFWQQEEIIARHESYISLEDQQCEHHFKDTHTRNDQGRYVVRLPFKKPPQLLGNSYNRASRMMDSLRNRFQVSAKYSETYFKFMKEYEDLQHMKLITDINVEHLHPNFYLSHHGMWRESSTTTKLRVVFNGSSRTTSGVSLNEILHTGPKLQVDLFNVLIWFRQFRYVFSVDIENMYRQIQVHPDDWRFQRIRWSHSDEDVNSYELTTVTYGLICAPYLALRTIAQLIEDEGTNFPSAVPCLTHGRYVDDIFGGAESIDEVHEIINQLHQLCKAGGFPLQKWSSNHAHVLHHLPSERLSNPNPIPFDSDSCVAVLGLQWKPTADCFQFSIDRPSTATITKRTILSTIAKLFDPLGLLSPVIIKAKILIQELWINKLNWDESLPSPLANQWITFVNELEDLKVISIPRWLGIKSDHQIQLHGFCDASTQAFAALIYLRTVNLEEKINVCLIATKTKVAPLKRLTIPRLELSGAVLLTKLTTHVRDVLNLKDVPIYLWTDSSITLTWIQNHPSRWKDFIQNRVVLIQEILPQAKWKFVSSKENPADFATRGMSPSKLASQTTWWKRPSWLSQTIDCWPDCFPSTATSDNFEERPNKVHSIITSEPQPPWNLLTRYSNLNKLLRTTAVCKRAVGRFKRIPINPQGPLSTTELESAKLYWINSIQQQHFAHEIKLLTLGGFLPKSNSLTKLTPFIDSSGFLRTGGRLQNSTLPPESKHLLILPKRSPLTELIIKDAHIRSCHGGTQITSTILRNSYWIIGGRLPIKNFILRCVICTRYRQKRAQQLMGQLPPERVTPTSRPFINTGIDYAGPLLIKTWKGRNARQYKAYIAVFVCFATSATHLELVSDYSADAFVAAYKRFTARRGICTNLFSDCGTNLIGANTELKELLSEASQEHTKLASLLANDGTQWHFNPPSAPHFGGKWEAAVKSVKFHLKRVLGNHLLTFEEMTTLLIQIEAVLNSRPLSPLSDDPEDLAALTPGHFLLGHAPTVLPEPSLEHINMSRLSRWQLLRQMLEGFWSRWSKECLQRFHDTSKWNHPTPSLKNEDMVLVIDERYPPFKWPLGRIIETHPGTDGHTRVVTVKTQITTLKRPIVKLCPLPIHHKSSVCSLSQINEGGR
ncbi:uncharacterized protein LOC114931136 [Nylanderia fulva]|uniref:uncharacterized protein LOC114931136 n=1 Tax=Nylanderia fulva TaxID=613905 RepID=UPI0010FB3050|nr:uncharacterized protein LOC114931136 [Nylanderia fulva]